MRMHTLGVRVHRLHGCMSASASCTAMLTNGRAPNVFAWPLLFSTQGVYTQSELVLRIVTSGLSFYL